MVGATEPGGPVSVVLDERGINNHKLRRWKVFRISGMKVHDLWLRQVQCVQYV